MTDYLKLYGIYIYSADSRKKGLQSGAKKGHAVLSKKGTQFHQKRAFLNRVQDTCFEHFQGGRHFNFSKFPDFSLTFPENFL